MNFLSEEMGIVGSVTMGGLGYLYVVTSVLYWNRRHQSEIIVYNPTFIDDGEMDNWCGCNIK